MASDNEENHDIFTSDLTSATHSAAYTHTPTTYETRLPGGQTRRRLLSRATERAVTRLSSSASASASASSSTNTNTAFNPQASEFVPTMATSSKRKASTSAKSGRSMPSSFHPFDTKTLTATLQERLPIIKTKDLFGKADPITSPVADFDLDGYLSESESEENPAILYRAPGAYPRRSLLASTSFEIPNGVRTKQSEAAKPSDATPRLSAVLLSRGADGAAPARYLPLCPATTLARGHTQDDLTVLPTHRNGIDNLQRKESQFRAPWPAKTLPVELFDLITANLARDDIKNMRLVNREFEANVSASLFRTSVVPFNTELYDMIDDEAKTKTRQPPVKVMSGGKGKGRATEADESAADADAGSLLWQNTKDDKEGKVYKGHGLKVFQGFGPHIKRFGMSFEVSESQLSQPPAKKELDSVASYHGSYTWPPPYYTRFANLAGLEHTADETSRMKSAFEKLTVVQELGLSVASGLGWLSGMDKSVRAHASERSTRIFGRSFDVPEHRAQAATEFWAALQQSQASFPSGYNAKEVTLACRELIATPADLVGLKGTHFCDTQLWSSVDSAQAMPRGAAKPMDNHLRVLYTTSAGIESTTYHGRASVVPSDLRKEQKEWLLETEWAQRAFLESYMLAVVDNPVIFAKVTVLNVAKLSSGFLPMIGREHFWDALPALQDVTLHVSPDWRSVAKDDAGFAEMTSHHPSVAVYLFFDVLRQRIAPKETVKKLNIGWVGGGEHAEGLFARNTSMLPCPTTQRDHTTANNGSLGLVFNHVEHLTLTNCWLTPPALDGLVKSHAAESLTKLTLDSVSLTAHPRIPPGGQQGGGGGAQLMGQMLANAAGQMPNFFNAPPMQQPLQPIQPVLPHQMYWQPPNNPIYPLQYAHAQQQFLQMQQMQQVNVFNAGQQWPPFNAGQQMPPFNAGQQMPVFNVGQQMPHINAGLQMPQLNAFNFPPLQQPQGFVAAAFPAAAVPPAAVAVPVMPPAPPPPAHWTDGHREGSWPEMLNSVSPGPVYSDYLEPPAPWEDPLPPRPATKLQTIEFISCGYAKILHHAPFDQLVIETDLQHHGHTTSPWFRVRQAVLKQSMMETQDRYLAQIVQNMPWRELNALQLAWGLTEGWQDTMKAEEAEWDGFLPGGTGRFSGVVHKGMPLASAV
ncbi:hypothetical protein LTR36_003548 [Oleoguttula mirabilis]|uniref:F-box domain-containing protein n=1 Tax=Oleoguttula mirabilis TaxID=1507867 RepID=A0AAV9JK48_9PEZI|nr:hypothetical protein LTR36_003548 [Oleoguttula mirabilis]